MEELYQELRAVLSAHASVLDVVTDEPGYYYLNTNVKDGKGKPHFFGMVKKGPKKVALHLMPLYCDASLAASISPPLKKRMQGKTCFNFTKAQPDLMNELGALTDKCIASYRADGKV